jgi:predicted nucleic acid-binding protein
VRYLADSNILLRLTKPDDLDYKLVRAALDSLWAVDVDLCYTSQNLAEFWNVCTRPADRNGFGLSIEETDRRSRLIEGELRFLPDNEQVHHEWRRLIVSHRVSGVQVHDARIVAAMQVHGVSHLLTFDQQDFVRYPEITVVHPRQAAKIP